MGRYFCACCTAEFHSDKPQDPQRDRGYGHCDRCWLTLIRADWIKLGYGGSAGSMTPEAADERRARYA